MRNGDRVSDDGVGNKRMLVLHHPRILRVFLVVGSVDARSLEPLKHFIHGLSAASYLFSFDAGGRRY